MSAETFNACVYLVDRQVEAGLGGHLAVTGPAGSLTYAELAARARVVVATPECAQVARAAVRLAPEVATLVLTGEPEAGPTT